MATFGAKTVERPDYDFTNIQSPDGSGMCKGKGFIPGHTKAEWDEFQEEFQRIQKEGLKFQEDVNKSLPEGFDRTNPDPGELLKLMESADKPRAEKLGADLFEATVKACKGHPSREELEALPEEYRIIFPAWLMQELSQPKFSSGSTPQPAATNGASTTRSNAI